MNSLSGSFRRRLCGISPRETRFDRRGFRGGAGGIREQLERVGVAFLAGYHAALEEAQPGALAARLDRIERMWRGFAYEGAAMGLALRDWLTPWRRSRVDTFLRGPGDAHAYMMHVGVGWLWARVPVRISQTMARMDPLLRWLALDGYGFHEAFFKWSAYLAGRPRPSSLMNYQARAFDQGFGRCLWFVDGGDVERIPKTIAGLEPGRHADLWSGVGLAATYAGGADADALRRLREGAGSFQPQLAQGSAFAAKARQRAGNLEPGTELATRTLCDLSAEDAARVTDDALEHLPADGPTPAYEVWRTRIQQHFQASQLAPS
jgi:hypothetical protein